MYLRWVAALCLVILLDGGVFAFEAAGTIQKVDAEKGQVVIRAEVEDAVRDHHVHRGVR
jgi:hypothetical protein